MSCYELILQLVLLAIVNFWHIKHFLTSLPSRHRCDLYCIVVWRISPKIVKNVAAIQGWGRRGLSSTPGTAWGQRIMALALALKMLVSNPSLVIT